jgi:hypothetical protein
MRGLCLAVACLVIAAPSGRAQAKKPPPKAGFQAFNGTLDDAFAHAAERNVPLVLVAIVENEQGQLDSDVSKFRTAVFDDPKLVDVLQYAQPIVACNQVHTTTEVEIDDGGHKTKKQICPSYRTEGCAWHQKQFDAIYREFQSADGELKSPSIIVVLPDHTIQQRWQTGTTEGVLTGIGTAVAAARAKLGEGLTEAQLVDVRALLQKAAKRAEAGEWGTSYVACAGVLAITQKTKQAEEARTRQKLALETLEKQRDEALEWLKGPRAVDGYKRLLELEAQSPGTPLEKDLPKLIKAAEGAKESRDAIAAYKREVEADALWREIEGLLADKQDKKAEPKIRVLLRKYAETPAGKRARERYPEWAAEEDAKKPPAGG